MSDTIEALTEAVRGRVITPSDSDYDDARAVYNAMHDRQPSAVVRCVDAADVMAAVAAARDGGLDLAVRGGGHSVPGFGTVDDGLVMDLSTMNHVLVDPDKKVARVGGGATWGDLDHATYPFGLAAPGGIISTTGVGGLTLGGGIGYLTRGVGLSIDNLLSADVVLADGRQVTASDYQNEDLFWALRGGGGNFGVVTSFEFQLHEVGDIVGGPMFYEVDDAAAVLECYREFIAAAPEQLGCFFGWQIAPPLPFIPEDRVGGSVLCLDQLLERSPRGGRASSSATTRRCRSESGAGRHHAVSGAQQRLRRIRSEGHAALLESGLSSPSSPTRRSRLTSSMARRRRTSARACISIRSTVRLNGSVPTRPPSDTETRTLPR